MELTDKEILARLKQDDVVIYEFLFNKFYKSLYYLAFKFLSNREISEETVQEVFIYLWENRQKIEITSSLKSYLQVAVKNKSINYLKSKYSQIHFTDITEIKHHKLGTEENKTLEEKELNQLIQKAIDSLPPKCKIIYNLSRNAGMTYQEIANELGISKETVKSQMGVSLAKIREYLKKYWEDIPD